MTRIGVPCVGQHPSLDTKEAVISRHGGLEQRPQIRRTSRFHPIPPAAGKETLIIIIFIMNILTILVIIIVLNCHYCQCYLYLFILFQTERKKGLSSWCCESSRKLSTRARCRPSLRSKDYEKHFSDVLCDSGVYLYFLLVCHVILLKPHMKMLYDILVFYWTLPCMFRRNAADGVSPAARTAGLSSSSSSLICIVICFCCIILSSSSSSSSSSRRRHRRRVIVILCMCVRRGPKSGIRGSSAGPEPLGAQQRCF